MTQDTIDVVKGVIVGTAGIIAIQLPTWLNSINFILGAFDGFYKFIVFCLTSCYLIYGIFNRKSQKENGTNK
jgi:hypothetical protein